MESGQKPFHLNHNVNELLNSDQSRGKTLKFLNFVTVIELNLGKTTDIF